MKIPRHSSSLKHEELEQHSNGSSGSSRLWWVEVIGSVVTYIASAFALLHITSMIGPAVLTFFFWGISLTFGHMFGVFRPSRPKRRLSAIILTVAAIVLITNGVVLTGLASIHASSNTMIQSDIRSAGYKMSVVNSYTCPAGGQAYITSSQFMKDLRNTTGSQVLRTVFIESNDTFDLVTSYYFNVGGNCITTSVSGSNPYTGVAS